MLGDKELWCETDEEVPDVVFGSKNRLFHEKSILYSKKGSKKLIPIKVSEMESHVNVNHIYCVPIKSSRQG
jgi:hypothetical protein